MRSTPAKYRVPIVLDGVVKERAAEAGYDSQAEYVVGLIRYDLMTRKAHVTTAALATLTRPEQDRVDDMLAKLFESGATLGGSWFHHMIEAAVKAAGTPEPEQPKMVAEILRRLAGA